MNNCLSIVALLLLCLCQNVQGEEVIRISLKHALESVDENNGELMEKRFAVKQTELDSELIERRYNPQFDIIAGVGPINKAYGNAVNSQNSEVTEIRNWRALYLLSIRGGLPLYSWGQKDNYLEAARLNNLVSKEEVNVKRNELRFKLKEIYYGNLLAKNSADFINETLKEVDGVIKKVKNNNTDLYRLEVFKNLLLTKKGEVDSKYAVSAKALRLVIGREDTNTSFLPQEDWLELSKRELGAAEDYRKMMNNERPELKQLKHGVSATKMLAMATKKSALPMPGLFIKYDFTSTDAREPQKSVFAYDPYNENSLVIGVGIKWNLNFGVSNTEASKYRVSALELEAKQKNATNGVEFLLEKDWMEVKTLQQQLDSAKEAAKYAKKLVGRALIGGAMGLINAKDIVEAYQARIITFKEYLQTIYEYNLAWARLSLTVGSEVDPLLVSE